MDFPAVSDSLPWGSFVVEEKHATPRKKETSQKWHYCKAKKKTVSHSDWQSYECECKRIEVRSIPTTCDNGSDECDAEETMTTKIERPRSPLAIYSHSLSQDSDASLTRSDEENGNLQQYPTPPKQPPPRPRRVESHTIRVFAACLKADMTARNLSERPTRITRKKRSEKMAK